MNITGYVLGKLLATVFWQNGKKKRAKTVAPGSLSAATSPRRWLRNTKRTMRWNSGSESGGYRMPCCSRLLYGWHTEAPKRGSPPRRRYAASLTAWMIILRSTELCLSHLGHLFHYSHSCFSTHVDRSHLVFWTLSSRTVWTSLNRVAQLLEMWISRFHLISVSSTGRTSLILLAYYAYAVSSLIVSLKSVCMVNSPCLFWERPSVCSLLYICCYACSV